MSTQRVFTNPRLDNVNPALPTLPLVNTLNDKGKAIPAFKPGGNP